MTVVFLAGACCACHAWAQAAKQSAVTGGVRQYASHPENSDSPFGDGDLSYLLAYEYHEGSAFWQFGLCYAPHVSATSLVEDVESVVTPQLRLVFEQGLLVLGAGVLKHYVRQKDAARWTEVYWELEAGFHTPVSPTVDLRALAYYTFRNLGDVGDLDTSQIEYGLDISYRF